MRAEGEVVPLKDPSPAVARQDGRLGIILAADGKLSSEHIDRVLELQRAEGLRFGEAALRLNLITADELRCAIAKQYAFPCPMPGNVHAGTEIIAAHNPLHSGAEALRMLRTKLLIRWSGAGTRQRALAVVSPASGEGRSFLAANLAVIFSQLGKRTLLIDADMRAPRQHRIFNTPNRVGLSALLAGRVKFDALLPVAEFGTLWLLPAGACPPNPQELLLRPSFPDLLGELRSEFDFIFFDTPPAKLYADAQSLAIHVGGAVLVARKDHTRIGDTAGVIRSLTDAGARVFGTVLNAF
jgi:chain length determinant protein tyrosine kinase EpsG